MVSKQDCIEANEIAIDAMKLAVTRLEALGRGMPDDFQARIDSRVERTNHEIELLEKINAHLRASTSIVQPMEPEAEERLRRLAGALDKAIRQDAILEATLETTISIINAAKEVRGLVDEHS
jgi:hypothetical protein